jgi:hypothetical protein
MLHTSGHSRRIHRWFIARCYRRGSPGGCPAAAPRVSCMPFPNGRRVRRKPSSRRSMPATYCYLLWFVPSPPLRLPASSLIRVVLFASSPSRWPAGRFPISERLRRRLHGPSGPLRPYPPRFAGALSLAPAPRSPSPCPRERRFGCAPLPVPGHGCSNTFALRLLCACIERNPRKYASI